MRHPFGWALLTLLACAACNCEGPVVPPGGTKGAVSGTLTLFQGAGTGVWSGPRAKLPAGFRSLSPKLAALRPRPALRAAPGERNVPGELIVRLEQANLSPAAASKLLLIEGAHASHGGYASEHLHLLRFVDDAGQPVDDATLERYRETLAAREGVRFVERNGRRFPTALPNDRLYGYQWHYPAMNLPAAWDVTQGSTAVVVAVIDTGIVTHGDLNTNVVQGIDFISDAASAQDGDGRDDDPTDRGKDLPNGQSSWHGTHVAGTIGAVSNNGTDVAGVDWNARILPVRVLGKGGGTDFDIAAAIVWSSGGSVPGVRANATPAAVLNMSLGGDGDPRQTYQEAIDAAVGRGATVVVAAGNENEATARKVPCSQARVVCVGATRLTGKRSSFSNYGPQVDVMAPGGEMVEDLNNDGLPDGILSTYRDEQNQPTVDLLQGTSMATPHVAGLVALMKAANPALTPAQVETVLKDTANASSKCQEGCGAGLVNAFAAVTSAKGSTPTGPAKLSLNTSELTLVGGATTPLAVTNLGGQALNVTVAASGGNAGRLSFPGGTTLTLAAGQSGELTVSANATGLADGLHPATIEVTSNGGNATVNARIRAGASLGNKSATLALVYQDAQGEWQAAGGGEVTPGQSFAYKFEVPAGKYYAIAAVDDNGNGEFFDEGERVGLFRNMDSPEEIEVTNGQTTGKIDFALVPVGAVDSTPALQVGAACTSDANCPEQGACVTDWPGGYCTRDCSTTACPAASKCYQLDTNVFACFATCSGPRTGRSNCRNGYVCEADAAGGAFCVPACTSDNDCTPGTCDLGTGYCS